MSLLKLHNIGKIYNSNDVLTIGIRNINLEFDLNEFVVIEGESGSGKSTLLNVIGANDTYEEGEMYFNGEETSHYGISEWEKYREENIATIFQDFNIIENLTVLENVELALLRFDDSKKRKKIAKDLIDKVGLTKQINQKGSKLSGGEKQRCVIARALAKDSPIILADEPTGNLDVKSSKDISKLLKDVSKDKLVIVVTHNPEYFKDYATRRVRVYDGGISENKEIVKTEKTILKREEIVNKRGHNLKNTFWIGLLNYKSRPKFTSMMSFCTIICGITIFIILVLFSGSLIKPLKATIDEIPIEGKVIITSDEQIITGDVLDELAYKTGAGFVLQNREYSQFDINIERKRGMLSDYTIKCVYSPYQYNLDEGSAVLSIPKSMNSDSEAIKNEIINANVGINNIEVVSKIDSNDTILYLSNNDLVKNGVLISAINSKMKIANDDAIAYVFRKSDNLNEGEVELLNSSFWNVKGKSIVFSIKSSKSFVISEDSNLDEKSSGIVVLMNPDDYDDIFSNDIKFGEQCVLYYKDSKAAKNAINNLPIGYMGVESTSEIYVNNAGNIFTFNIIYYLLLICVSFCFSMIVSIIFSRSVKIFQTDFTVYKTLGISRKVSFRSLYVQMFLIFIPTLILLPIVSYISTIIPGSTITFISLGNYIFVEIMMLLIVELVAFSFNKNLNSQSIRKSLRRGSK